MLYYNPHDDILEQISPQSLLLNLLCYRFACCGLSGLYLNVVDRVGESGFQVPVLSYQDSSCKLLYSFLMFGSIEVKFAIL